MMLVRLSQPQPQSVRPVFMMLAERSSLLLRLALLLIVGFLAVSLSAFHVARTSLRNSLIDEALPLTSDNIYSEVQKDILRPVFISSLMAHDTFLRDWVLSGEQDTAQLTRYLAEIKAKYDTLTSFFVSARTQNYYYPDGILKQVHANEPRDAWFYRVSDMDTDYELNVDPDMANRDMRAIFINYRVLDYDGRFIGATGVGLPLALVAKQIKVYEQRFHRHIYFVDHNGRIVLGSPSHRHSPDGMLQTMPGLRDIANRILVRDTTPRTLEYQDNGNPVLVHTRHIPELDWHLVVEQSDQYTLDPLRQALMLNLGIAALITLLALGSVLFAVNRYQRRLEDSAANDTLTGTLNRQAFDLVFAQALRDARRTRQPLALLLFDIDHFKEVNDNYGHLSGDTALRTTASLLRSQLRDSDILARWGGEEFILLLKNCTSEDALAIAENLRQRVAAHDFSQSIPNSGLHHLTLSIGIGISQPDDTPEHLFARADLALYQAKAQGRNRTIA